MNGIDDAVRAGAADGARAGLLEALRSPAGRELIAGIVRAAVAEVVPNLKRMEDVERLYGYPIRTQRRHIREGRLRATQIGRLVLVDVSQLQPVGAGEIAALAAAARR